MKNLIKQIKMEIEANSFVGIISSVVLISAGMGVVCGLLLTILNLILR